MSDKILIKRFKDLENPENNIIDESKYITYRNKLEKLYKKSDNEFIELISILENKIGNKVSEEFSETIIYLVLIARHYLNESNNNLILKDRIRYLTKLENSLRNTLDILKTDTKGHNEILKDLIITMDKTNTINSYNNCIESSYHLLNACIDTKASLKESNNILPPREIRTNIRELVAEELARALNNEGVKISKYKDNVCNLCYKELLEYISCQIENTLPIVSKAIDSYPTKEKFPELNYI
tara:strand:+ start:825 stop:1547 length:723 start_codon:yes stop_codon:yes gene_type:complete